MFLLSAISLLVSNSAAAIFSGVPATPALRFSLGAANNQLCAGSDCTYNRWGFGANFDASTIVADRFLVDGGLNLYGSEGDPFGPMETETDRFLFSWTIGLGVIPFSGFHVRVGGGRSALQERTTDGTPLNEDKGFAFMGDGGYQYFINRNVAVGASGRYERHLYQDSNATMYGGGLMVTYQPGGGEKDEDSDE